MTAMDVEEVMDQAEEPRSISDESDIESERKDQPPSSKWKFQGFVTYNTKYDPRWKQQYPCIDAVKGDVYSFFCCTYSKKMSCKHMGISDVKRHIGIHVIQRPNQKEGWYIVYSGLFSK